MVFWALLIVSVVSCCPFVVAVTMVLVPCIQSSAP